MKVKSLIIFFALLIGFMVTLTLTATKEEIEQSINDGIVWLVAQQNLDGSWNGYEQVAHTGLAVMKLEDRAIELGYDSPFDPAYPYSANVIAGLDYIFTNAHIMGISPQPAGNPDTNGNGFGIYISDGYHRTYATGIALMAIVGSRDPSMVVTAGPVAGWTYGLVVQDAVDYLAFGQNDSGSPRGAWGYTDNQNWSDNSNAGYAILGLDFAESGTFGFNATVPVFLKSELNVWIDYIQNDVNGDPGDGGSGYTTPNDWVNILKTGNLIYQMVFYGDSVSTPRVMDAVNYIERHWNDNNDDPGFRPHHYQAMYCLMKGLERIGINTISVGGSDIDWFDEISTIIVNSQNADGSWPPDYWGDNILSAGWALLTLEKVTPGREVYVDIKPGSCPNPLNTKSKGVLPVAILGTEGFDVTSVDPASIQLEGVSPLRWAYEDVATPFEGELCECHDLDGDGYLDLTLKFNSQEVVAALGTVNDGDVIKLTVTGNLKEEEGGAPFSGQDCVVILLN